MTTGSIGEGYLKVSTGVRVDRIESRSWGRRVIVLRDAQGHETPVRVGDEVTFSVVLNATPHGMTA